ncbi:MAG: hypothetical protein ACK5YG_06355, partial [Alphaproteobacteria bacterium]
RSLGFSTFGLREADERKESAFAFDGLGVALDEHGKSLGSVAARRLEAFRVMDAGALFAGPLPAWIFLQERLDPSSATALRARGLWPLPEA